jgi:hypothetical protein
MEATDGKYGFSADMINILVDEIYSLVEYWIFDCDRIFTKEIIDYDVAKYG